MRETEQKGITLIALVITIIVLLILAGVAISMLSGENGILKKAADAKEKTEVAQKQEETTLTDYELISHFTLNNSKYKCKYGFITGVQMGELASNLVKALPEDYSLYEIDTATLQITGNPISAEDEETKFKTGMAITKDGKTVAKVVLFGDVNGDGAHDITDSSLVTRYIKGRPFNFAFNESNLAALDVNHDKIIDSKDYDCIYGLVNPDPENPTVIIQNVEVKFVPEIN